MSSASTQHHLVLPQLQLDYRLQRHPRRTRLAARWDERGLCVLAPPQLSLSKIEQWLRQEQVWLLKMAHSRPVPPPAAAWACPEQMLWMGQPRTLQVEPQRQRVHWGEHALLLPAQATREKLHRACLNHAGPALQQRLLQWAQHTGLQPQGFALTQARGRWGSCTSLGVVRLNWRLVHAPLWVCDYVMVHELAHLQHLNHSPAFWALVAQWSPHKLSARDWLRQHGPSLFWLETSTA